MTKSILFFVTLLGLCYEACGAMLKGSDQVSQPSQFKAEKSFIQNNNENSLRQLAEDKKKGFFVKFLDALSKKGEENAKSVLMTLLGDTEREEGKKSLQALKRMADRKMWNTEWWMNDFKGMAKSSAEQLAQPIKGRLKKGLTPPVSMNNKLELKELLSVIDEERKSDKWSELYDSGYFKSKEYMEEQRLEETATNVLKILFAYPQREEAEKSLKALKRMADRKMWNTEWWINASRGMAKSSAELLAQSIKGRLKKGLTPPVSIDKELELKELLSVIDDERKSDKWSKLYDRGYFKSKEYLEEQRLEETATNVLKILFAYPQQEEAEKSLKALKRMADRNMWNIKWWLKSLGQADEWIANVLSKSIKFRREAPLQIPPPLYGKLSLEQLMAVIDDETTDEKLTKLYDSGKFGEYRVQLQEAVLKSFDDLKDIKTGR